MKLCCKARLPVSALYVSIDCVINITTPQFTVKQVKSDVLIRQLVIQINLYIKGANFKASKLDITTSF